MSVKKIVHGDDLLYRFFQDALTTQPELFATLQPFDRGDLTSGVRRRDTQSDR